MPTDPIEDDAWTAHPPSWWRADDVPTRLPGSPRAER
jgi:hypothetical protein